MTMLPDSVPSHELLNQAIGDLATDAFEVYTELDIDTNRELELLKDLSAVGSEPITQYWYHCYKNLKLAYTLGYLAMIANYGTDWIEECCHELRNSRDVAIWFRQRVTPYVLLSQVRLPSVGERWHGSKTKYPVLVRSVEANEIYKRYYRKELLVIFNNSVMNMREFLREFHFVDRSNIPKPHDKQRDTASSALQGLRRRRHSRQQSRVNVDEQERKVLFGFKDEDDSV
jgi:hypothetical protein